MEGRLSREDKRRTTRWAPRYPSIRRLTIDTLPNCVGTSLSDMYRSILQDIGCEHICPAPVRFEPDQHTIKQGCCLHSSPHPNHLKQEDLSTQSPESR